jgi:ATP-binding cassette subfamily C protein
MVQRYPRRCAVVLGLSLLAGIAESLGIMTLLPVLGLALDGDIAKDHPLAARLQEMLTGIGIPLTLPVLLTFIVVLLSCKSLLTLAATRAAGNAAGRVSADLRISLIRALMSARWSHVLSRRTGGLSNAMGIEAERSAAVFQTCAKIATSLVQALLYIVLAFFTSVLVSVAGIVVGLLLFALLYQLTRIARHAANRQTAILRGLVERMTDILNALKGLKAMGLEQKMGPLLESETEDLDRARQRETVSSAALVSVQEPILAAVLACGIYVVVQMKLMPFVQLLFMAVVFYRIVGNISVLQGNVQLLARLESAFWSITGLIADAERDREKWAGNIRPAKIESIAFSAVSFAYDRVPVLHDVTFEIACPGMTTLIGPSGSGKTTVADLLIGLHAPTAGQISVNNVPLAKIDMAWWRDRIGYVPQEPVLFHDTIVANITLRDPDIAQDDVERALRSAGAWDFVQSQADGLDTIVGERGGQLSGGQRQRIALARALARKPQLLILDEATTALDPATEQGILQTIAQLKASLAILAISHQPAILDITDVVLRTSSGAVVDAGTTPAALPRAVSWSKPCADC